MGAHVSPAVGLGDVFTSYPGPPFATWWSMRTPRIIAALVLSLSCAIGAAACTQSTETSPETPQRTATEDAATEASDDGDIAAGESTLGESAHMADHESTNETRERSGYENPGPGPGTILPGGYDPGGPGAGWGHGWADDPQYAPYCTPHDPDPYKEQRAAKQREYDRISAENRRHGGGGQSEGVAHRSYPGGKQVAPDADSVPTSVHKPQHGEGPLNDKARCQDACWEQFLIDTSYCRKIRDKDSRQQCWIKSEEDYGLCVRECSRKYPGK